LAVGRDEAMRAKMLLDTGKPKVRPAVLRRLLRASGFEVVEDRADFGVVVGGDGRFSAYGRTEQTPLLFVGMRSRSPTGSRAYLAEAYFDELPEALQKIAKGGYSVKEYNRLKVIKNQAVLGEVFTDVYLQRGAESNCIRYQVKVRGRGLEIEEVAIGDGIVVCTPAGATGYYSYPDRVKGERLDPFAHASIPQDRVGVCHVTPTYTERPASGDHPLRYTIPWGSRVEVGLFRPADARLYGITESRRGIRVSKGDRVIIAPGTGVTRVITFPD
jgi:hypothetical protein